MLGIVLAAGLIQAPLADIGPDKCNVETPLPIAELVDLWRKDPEVNFSDEHYILMGGTPQVLHAAIERCDQTPTAPICDVIGFQLGLIREWMLELTASPDQERHQLVATRNVRIAGLAPLQDPDSFQLECRAQPPATPTRPNADAQGQASPDDAGANAREWGAQWRLAQDAVNLRKPSRNLREFATYAFTDDVKNETETRNIQLAFGRNFVRSDQSVSVMPYLAAHRLTQRAASPDEENLFQLGLNARYRLGAGPGNRLGYLGTDIAYLTDDSLEASAWRVGLDYTPSLRLPGYQAYYALTPGGPVEFVWTVEAALDHLSIDEVGDAFDGSEDDATRIGGDFLVAFRTSQPVGGVTPQFSLSYAVREPFGEDGDSLSNVRAALEFLPSKDGVFEFGVAYQSGEDIDSGKFSQQWTASIGVRY